ncbi:hypothetical protein [Kineococcus auxinigenes]|uniref:hypothetical protein n=1 Tax=unclassified Kineococcus TaxID=2621656 RepID=UPI003D7C51C5
MSAAAPPRLGYRLTVPAAWDRVDLTSPHRDRVVRDLVARQFAGLDDQPVARRRATALLLEQVSRAHDLGGLEAHLSVRPVGGVVVPASLLVHALPGRPGPRELHERLSGSGDVTVSRLPAGDAVRRRRTTGAGQGADDAARCCLLEHFVPVPAAPGLPPAVLVLAGTTVPGPLEEPLVELFDVIARSLRWTGEAAA